MRFGSVTPEALYFPVKAGDRRVYSKTSSSGVSEVVETVTKAEEWIGRFFVTTESTGEESESAIHEVSPKGVIHHGKEVIGDGMTILKLPAKVGDSWEFVLDNADDVKFVMTVLKVDEEIEVPAGKFRAICVESWSAAVSMRVMAWFAPTIGFVKESIKLGGTGSERILTSFTTTTGAE